MDDVLLPAGAFRPESIAYLRYAAENRLNERIAELGRTRLSRPKQTQWITAQQFNTVRSFFARIATAFDSIEFADRRFRTRYGDILRGIWKVYEENMFQILSWDNFLDEYNQLVRDYNAEVDRILNPQNYVECKMCSNPAKFKCGSCMDVQYCGRACQVEDWEEGNHKYEC